MSPSASRDTTGSHPPRLLDQVRAAIRARHYSLRTEEAYLGWIRRYILHHRKRHPATMGPAEITAFLTALAVERRVSASTQNQAMAALLFLYRDVLGREPGWLDGVVRARRPRRLPVVLGRGEVERLLGALHGAAWLVATLLYGTGMRLNEGLRLRVKDLDWARYEIVVREGKGNRDRVTMLPRALEPALHAHLARVRRVHDSDVRAGVGAVALPGALAAKYPNAAREWGWQWVFPAARLWIDPRGGERRRAPRRRHHDDLHARPQPRWPRRRESRRPPTRGPRFVCYPASASRATAPGTVSGPATTR